MEVFTRVHCCEEGCEATLEYWGEVSLEKKYDQDTFGSREWVELEMYPPDQDEVQERGWSTEGSYAKRYFCPIHQPKPPKKRRG